MAQLYPGWEKFVGISKHAATVTAWGDNRLDLFVTGVDDAVYHKWWDGVWHPDPPDGGTWERFAGVSTHAPAVASWCDGRLDLFVTGQDGAIYHKWFDNHAWYPSPPESTQWERFAGTSVAGPAVASWSHGRLNLFVTGEDGAIYHKWFDNNTWYPSPPHVGSWERFAGWSQHRPSVVSWEDGRLDLFVTGRDKAIYHKWYDNGIWYPSPPASEVWERFAGASTCGPAVASLGNGSLDLFVTGKDAAIYHKWFDNFVWYPSPPDVEIWHRYPADAKQGPAATSWSANRLDLFTVGQGDHVYHAWDG